MKQFLALMLAGLTFPAAVFASDRDDDFDNTPVYTFDLGRYLGKWYEIARFDHYFEKGISNATAFYSLNDNGTVKVVNSGWKNGKFKVSEGKAKQPYPVEKPALMRVSFFGPFYSDYRVLMLDTEYQYALVGSGDDDYLWILSREPMLDPVVKDFILIEAEKRGYDTDELIWVDQTENIKEKFGIRQ